MIRRVAYLSMHTSPLLQPGQGDAGGMNVYVNELSETMSARGIEIDVFTRRDSADLPDFVDVSPGYRVHHVEAGPAEPLPVAKLPIFVREYAVEVVKHYANAAELPDMVHSHYWLSGWAGLIVKRDLGVPMANSFHTLGRVKDLTRRLGEPPETLLRIAAEHEVIEGSDCVVASTPLEAEDLLAHYGADPARLCMSPPGVNHDIFSPGDRLAARRSLGLDGGPIVLFVGRIQPLKGLDVTLGAFELVHNQMPGARLVVVGGPSGPKGNEELRHLGAAIQERGLGSFVSMLPPVSHDRLVDFYRAADVLHVPSRSESFGLVAAEAQSCGLPVVAARVGGLTHAVEDGVSGLLVDGWSSAGHAAAILRVLTEPGLAEGFSRGALAWSERFSWDATANRFLELYNGAVARASSG
jgi:D-inositol-3-phosphate glycosyltransferase